MHDHGHTSVLTRRSVLLGAAAASTAPVLAGGISSSAAAAVPMTQVVPWWSETLRRSYGLGILPPAGNPAYSHVDAWAQQVADLGAPYIRGRYLPGRTNTARVVERCRALGLRWLMSVIPEDWSMSERELHTVLVHVRDHAADVCAGIEGMNEPNHNRNGTPVRSDWPQLTVGYARVIKTFLDSTPSLSHAVAVGPSLQMGADDPSPDFYKLGDAGIVPYLDYAGLHSYPSGWGPATYVDLRLGYVRDAWGDIPTWVTETGYNTANELPFSPDGPKPVPQDVAALYGPRSVIEFATRGCKASRFQLLDRPNAANDDPSRNYGILENTGDDPSTWSPKKEYVAMQRFLASLRDTASSHTPSPLSIGVRGPNNLKWVVVAKSDGTKRLLMYRAAAVWDPDTRTRRTVRYADVTVTDRAGTRVVSVGAKVVSLKVR
jgi:hypothetical protein